MTVAFRHEQGVGAFLVGQGVALREMGRLVRFGSLGKPEALDRVACLAEALRMGQVFGAAPGDQRIGAKADIARLGLERRLLPTYG
jgi:hypothetical protein